MVDEGQDLTLELYRILIRIARHVSIFADFNQMIKENRESESELLSLLNGSIPLKKVALNENFRNTQSIHDFAEKYLVQIPNKKPSVSTQSKEIPRPLISAFQRRSIEQNQKLY
jgi:superfamily I DNA/RNA helicase